MTFKINVPLIKLIAQKTFGSQKQLTIILVNAFF